MPPHLAHSVVAFEKSVGADGYKTLCEEAKNPENLEKVVKWMVERDASNSGHGVVPNLYGWLGDQCHMEIERSEEVCNAMKNPIVEHFEWQGDILAIVVSQVGFHVHEWYLGFAYHCMKHSITNAATMFSAERRGT